MGDKWLTITAKKGVPTVIDIDGDIGSSWFNEGDNTTISIKNQLQKIANLKTEEIIVNINSLGGSVSDGLGIHDALAQHSAHVTTKINGLTASAATIIAMAGDERQMSDNALFLIHQPMIFGGGNVNQFEAELEKLRTVSDRLLNLYVKRTGKVKSEIEALYNENDGNGKWITSDEAKEYGLIDSVFEPMDVAATTRKISNEFLNKNKFPKLPKELIMSEEQKTEVKSDDITTEAKSGLINEVMDKMKDLFQPKVKEEKPEVKDEVKDNVDVPEVKDEIKDEVKAKEVIEVNPLQKQVDELTAELTTVKSKLAEADAGSTKPKGKIGVEGEEPETTPEEKMLLEDVKTLDGAINFVR